MWWGVHDGAGWWMLFGGVWMLLFWGAVIGLVVWGVRTLAGRQNQLVEREDAVEIARRRFARGDITREEFEDIKSGLSGK